MTFADQRHASLLRTTPYPLAGVPTGSIRALGAAITAGGSANTKGAWVEQIASTAEDVAMIEMWSNIRVGANGAFTGMLVDIGIGGGAGTVDSIIVPDIVVGEHFGGGEFMYTCRFWLPIHIPAGSRISARNQGNLASDTYQPMMSLYYGTTFGTFDGYRRATSLGVTPASSSYPDSGNLANNAWTEVVAATTEHYAGVTAHFCGVNGAGLANAFISVDVGIGGAGSEAVIGQYNVQTSVAETIVGLTGPTFIEHDIPQGSRLALRKNDGAAALGGNLIGWGY